MSPRSPRKSTAVKKTPKRKKTTTKKKKQSKKISTKKTSTSKSSKRKIKRKVVRNVKLRYLLLFAVIAFSGYTLYLNYVVQNLFDGKRWALPAKVYARPLELYVGSNLSKKDLLSELKLLGFRNESNLKLPGSYFVDSNEIILTTRAFQFWDEMVESKVLKINFDSGKVASVYSFTDESEVDVIRIEPVIIGGIYPVQKEDRLLVKFDSVPELLKSSIQIVEDRNFYDHHGLYYKGIVRALWANVQAGKAVQGGSTLTQQLVKNFFLTNKRNLWRKANEAVMSLLLEWHYSKDEIFEAYINEVYLGQDKARAIHGFGLASRYYFDRDLDDLEIQHIAMLVALVKGPSYYNPRRSAKRLLKRRNLVLDLLTKFNVINIEDAKRAKRKPLGIIKSKPNSISSHPAFLELVKRQLKTFYREKDLASEGLQVFTTLDPILQKNVEKIVQYRTKLLDAEKKLHGHLQAAAIVTNTTNSEILALVGDSNPYQSGFNRALDAIRPIGSLIKPAVYLTALENNKYTPLSLIEDKVLHIKGPAGDVWSPHNYDKKEHGKVALYKALSHSYNLASVRLGLKLGFENIQQTIRNMGVTRKIPAYPSMLLGSVNMSPYEVTQMYHSLASGGFIMPLNAIREVLAIDGTPLNRFPLKIEQTLESNGVKMVNSILHNVTVHGTAKSISKQFPISFIAAGKTGTTDELRDSWFAGFTGQHLAVTWLGVDDNTSSGLTGASGALNVWSDIMRSLNTRPIAFNSTASVEYIGVDPLTLKKIDSNCENAVLLFMRKQSIPEQQSNCEE